MKKFKFTFCLIVLFLAMDITCVFAEGGKDIYRLYNGQSGEHLYTSDAHEAEVLATQMGWTDEGLGWTSPESGDPVYRLYNPTLADHLYTKDENEVNVLTSQQGWQKDNEGKPLYYSSGSMPIYRLYQPSTGRHHLTTDANENNTLGSSGSWNQEGVGFSALIESEIPGIENIKNHYSSLVNNLKAKASDQQIGYVLFDINRDGYKELIIGMLNDPYTPYIIGVYDDQEPARSCGQVLKNYKETEDGYIFGIDSTERGILPGYYYYLQSTGKISDEFGTMNFMNYENKFFREDGHWVHGGLTKTTSAFTANGRPYYHIFDENDEIVDVSKEEYDNFMKHGPFLALSFKDIKEF